MDQLSLVQYSWESEVVQPITTDLNPLASYREYRIPKLKLMIFVAVCSVITYRILWQLFKTSPIFSGKDHQLGASVALTNYSLARRDESLRKIPLSGILALTGGAEMLLDCLWEKIPLFEALDHAIILASECYVTNNFIRHRFILLELYYNHQTFWIRLDRRRGQNGLAAFILGSSTSPSRDTVEISASKEGLIKHDDKRENRQECNLLHYLRLGEMRHFFRLMIDSLLLYRLFDANCWCFVTAIQQYLQHYARARFIQGELIRPYWAMRLRRQLQEKTHYLYRGSIFRSLADEMCDAAKQLWTTKSTGSQLFDPRLREVVVNTIALAEFLGEDSITHERRKLVERSLRSIADTIYFSFIDYDVRESTDYHSGTEDQYSPLLWIMTRFAQIEALNSGAHLPLVYLHLLQAALRLHSGQDHFTQASLTLKALRDHSNLTFAHLVRPARYCSRFMDPREGNEYGEAKRTIALIQHLEYTNDPRACVVNWISAEWDVLDLRDPPHRNLDGYASLLNTWRECKCGCGGTRSERMADYLWEYGDLLGKASRDDEAYNAYEESITLARISIAMAEDNIKPRKYLGNGYFVTESNFAKHLRQRSHALAEANPSRSWALLQESIDVSRMSQNRQLLANSLRKMALRSPNVTPEERCSLLNEAIVWLWQDLRHSFSVSDDLSRLARFWEAFALALKEANHVEASNCAYQAVARHQQPELIERVEFKIQVFMVIEDEIDEMDEDVVGVGGFSALTYRILFPLGEGKDVEAGEGLRHGESICQDAEDHHFDLKGMLSGR